MPLLKQILLRYLKRYSVNFNYKPEGDSGGFMSKEVSAVVVCAGNSSRMGGVDKIFSYINGVPVIIRTLAACCKSSFLKEIVVVAKKESFKRICNEIDKFGIDKPCVMAQGGNVRALSVRNGVLAAHCEYVAIMDGARPLIRPENIDITCSAAFEFGAAALGVPMNDTVKRIDGDGNILDTVDRQNLLRIQTPQVFLRSEYLELSEKAAAVDKEFTDDCSIYEYFGRQVKTVLGSDDNLKITVRDDLDICSRLCSVSSVRVGHGYDVHRLEKERELWLCGERINFEMGLSGHSDADVAVHALIDAMLGAAAMGDIGQLFPDSDDRYKGISSIALLKSAAADVFTEFTFGNCDITIVAQKPKLAQYIPKMRVNIAKALGVSLDLVSVKATTEESLGFTGALEGISAHAVCTLYVK